MRRPSRPRGVLLREEMLGLEASLNLNSAAVLLSSSSSPAFFFLCSLGSLFLPASGRSSPATAAEATAAVEPRRKRSLASVGLLIGRHALVALAAPALVLDDVPAFIERRVPFVQAGRDSSSSCGGAAVSAILAPP